MKTILFFLLSLTLFGCAVSHKRGADAQVTLDYYLQNRGDLPTELTKMMDPKVHAQGEVTVQWSINDKGETQDIKILNDSLHNDLINERIVEQLKTMSFPKAPRFTTTTVDYTYQFQFSKKP